MTASTAATATSTTATPVPCQHDEHYWATIAAAVARAPEPSDELARTVRRILAASGRQAAS